MYPSSHATRIATFLTILLFSLFIAACTEATAPTQDDSDPYTITLLEPAAGSEDAALYPTFRWEGPDPAETGIAYELRIGPPDAWHHTITNIEAREYSLGFALEPGRDYRWQVAIRLEPNSRVESEARPFATATASAWRYHTPYPHRPAVAELPDGDIAVLGLHDPNSELLRLTPEGEVRDRVDLGLRIEPEGWIGLLGGELAYISPGRGFDPPTLFHFNRDLELVEQKRLALTGGILAASFAAQGDELAVVTDQRQLLRFDSQGERVQSVQRERELLSVVHQGSTLLFVEITRVDSLMRDRHTLYLLGPDGAERTEWYGLFYTVLNSSMQAHADLLLLSYEHPDPFFGSTFFRQILVDTRTGREYWRQDGSSAAALSPEGRIYLPLPVDPFGDPDQGPYLVARYPTGADAWRVDIGSLGIRREKILSLRQGGLLILGRRHDIGDYTTYTLLRLGLQGELPVSGG